MDYSSLDYSNYYTTTSSNPLGMFISIAFWVLSVIGLWKMFTKAGEAGWKAIIPIYGEYIKFKIAGKKFVGYLVTSIIFIISYIVIMFSSAALVFTAFSGGSAETGSGLAVFTGIAAIVALVCLIVLIVIKAKLCAALSRSFGHGGGYAVGLFFLDPIFHMILGFNQDQYLGPNGGQQ